MTNKLPGGPAFPTETDFTYQHGMSLRDYFAAKAMQGMCARVNWSDADVAARAYSMADAMLKASEQ